MKMFKKTLMLMMAFMFMFVGVAPAFAVPLDVVEVCSADGSECRILDDSGKTFFVPTDPSNHEYNWHAWQTTDGKAAYCYDMTKERPATGDGVDYADNMQQMDAGVAYILEHGAANPSNPTNRERWITQGAIWLYREGLDNFAAPYTDTNNVFPEMLQLVNAAKQAKASGNASSGSIDEISVSSNDMALEGDYYVSGDITPNVKGVTSYTVAVSGVDGAEVVSNSGNTIAAGSSFKVRVPKAAGVGKTVKVTVSIQTKAFIINPTNNSDYQNMVYLSEDTRNISKEINLTTTMPKVCVDYKIVGSVIPDAKLTDPTPGKNCFDKGTEYNQEKELTTRTDCKFKGWFTKEELTGKWTDGTALENDMTLYGAWECPQTVDVPATAASTSFIIVGIGLVIVAAGCGVYVFKVKKQTN